MDRLFPADRWLDNRWLVQAPIVLQCPPNCTTEDFYRRELEDQAGFTSWFLAWRTVTDGPEAFGDVAPASIVAAGQSGILYHFTVAADRVRLLRGLPFPLVFVDLEPGVPHTYRLELYDDTYIWYIDGQIADTGVPEGPYPTDGSFIVFGARASIEDSITRWDYVRFGLIPIDGSGDFDSDDTLDLDDFFFVHECLAQGGPAASATRGCAFADMDQDGDVDFHDFALFQLTFTGAE